MTRGSACRCRGGSTLNVMGEVATWQPCTTQRVVVCGECGAAPGVGHNPRGHDSHRTQHVPQELRLSLSVFLFGFPGSSYTGRKWTDSAAQVSTVDATCAAWSAALGQSEQHTYTMTWDASSQGDNRLALSGSVVTRWGGVCLETGRVGRHVEYRVPLHRTNASPTQYLLLHADLRQNNAGQGLAVPS
ncbi:hypothetical protein E2C01_075986 [Portunus trituberculatus]|uniref:Uncharacterized protein n=1 Tax=Portunus trituberculatus TaxID=210409 RepID=A0A5B7IM18_PORTR|nr:hypothetical protein [Portunus trituberculatus]